jgi:hypothetical protein
MLSSTRPVAESPSRHPVHRANAMLRHALLSSASATPDPAEIWGRRMFRLEPASVDLTHGPLGITSPNSPVALQDLVLDDAPAPECQSTVTNTPDGSAPQSLEDASEGEDMLDDAVQQQLQTMVHAFHERQRQASLVVACSVITALVLTLGGLILLFSMTETAADHRENATSKGGSSVARRAAISHAVHKPIRVQVNNAAKSAPLLIHAKSEPVTPALGITNADVRIILALPGRPLALGPLLPLGSARYLLLRGLPEDATLSAGRRTGPSTWMVKGEDVAGLALTLGTSASGDYPTEAYLLGADDGPQARRRLILRVDPAPSAQERETTLNDLRTVHESARNLLGQGNVVSARRILTDLAERGLADAAYELALTYDQEVLAKAGLDNIAGDMEVAQAWYAQAAQDGHTEAAQRLRTFAKRRAGA